MTYARAAADTLASAIRPIPLAYSGLGKHKGVLDVRT
jgi:hypothetical protein